MRDHKGLQVEGTVERLLGVFRLCLFFWPLVIRAHELLNILSVSEQMVEDSCLAHLPGGWSTVSGGFHISSQISVHTMDVRPSAIRIQLVDDQALVRKALASMIEAVSDFDLVAAMGTVDEAVRCAEQLQPDVVLMDVLPEPSIFQGVAQIIERCPGTKVVFLDDSPLDTNVREALRLGAAGYLTKQQPFGQIEAALRQAARGERVYAPEVSKRLILSPDGVRLSIGTRDRSLSSLTPREVDVLLYLAQGSSVKQCAQSLGIGVSTVGNHKSRLMKKLDIHKTVELTRLAIREGLIPNERPTNWRAEAHDETNEVVLQ